MSDRAYVGMKLEAIVTIKPESAEETIFIGECNQVLEQIAKQQIGTPIDKKLSTKIYNLEKSDMAEQLYNRYIRNKIKKERAAEREKLKKIIHKAYEENRIARNNPNEKCNNCTFYNGERRNENGEARCSKHPFWIKDNGLCDSFTSKLQTSSPTKNESATIQKRKNVALICLLFLGYALSVPMWFYGLYLYGSYYSVYLDVVGWVEPHNIGVILMCIASVLILCLSAIVWLVSKEKFRGSTLYKEKCYKKINRFHSYYISGSITEDEFNKLKQEILKKIK